MFCVCACVIGVTAPRNYTFANLSYSDRCPLVSNACLHSKTGAASGSKREARVLRVYMRACVSTLGSTLITHAQRYSDRHFDLAAPGAKHRSVSSASSFRSPAPSPEKHHRLKRASRSLPLLEEGPCRKARGCLRSFRVGWKGERRKGRRYLKRPGSKSRGGGGSSGAPGSGWDSPWRPNSSGSSSGGGGGGGRGSAKA